MSRLSLHPRPDWTGEFDQETRSLWLDGWPTATRVNGTELVFQLAVAEGFLLFTENDWGGGCQSWLHPLDHRGRCLDRITFQEVTDAAIRSIQTVNSYTVEFQTYDAPQIWRLEVVSGHVSFAWTDLLRRCNRHFWSKRRLRLTRVPKRSDVAN
jgi:hypothetical protein